MAILQIQPLLPTFPSFTGTPFLLSYISLVAFCHSIVGDTILLARFSTTTIHIQDLLNIKIF